MSMIEMITITYCSFCLGWLLPSWIELTQQIWRDYQNGKLGRKNKELTDDKATNKISVGSRQNNG